MNSDHRVIIVTGANKGIGYQVFKELAVATKGPAKIYLTCRNVELGTAALTKVCEETKKNRDGGVSLDFHQLDITDEKSIINFTKYIDSKYGKNSIDVLINNAGIATFGAPDPKGEIATRTIKTNYFGTVMVTEHLMDYFNHNARIIFNSSGVAKYHGAPREVQTAYYIENFKTKKEIDDHLNSIIKKAQRGEYENGVPSRSYCDSKAGLNTYTWLLSHQYQTDPRKLLFLSCDPGWTRTDTGGPDAPLSLEEGAVTIIYLSTCDFNDLYKHNGRYFHKSAMEDW
ncbi:hypothetical protein BB561_000579 [Smittium simulii]|uniref:Carbonyl reductase [NADPH] 1 n=1 Tax=Smittium simulii TaxID=133385 RepID=A0A2T9YYE8_9FUNG|nr:hypothetical protein BB561_000579 [Smittium simulii]